MKYAIEFIICLLVSITCDWMLASLLFFAVAGLTKAYDLRREK